MARWQLACVALLLAIPLAAAQRNATNDTTAVPTTQPLESTNAHADVAWLFTYMAFFALAACALALGAVYWSENKRR
jgi:alpha-ketoglutarate-dependent taurine dioxygenase